MAATEANLLKILCSFSERNLLEAVQMDDGVRVSQLKSEAARIITEHLSTLPGLGKIEIDPDCTDVYPSPASNSVRLRDLGSPTISVIMYPKPNPDTGFTSSPITTALAAATKEVEDLRREKATESLVAAESPTPNASAGTSSKARKRQRQKAAKQSGQPASQTNDFAQRLKALEDWSEDNIAKLNKEVASLKADNAKLMREGNQLRQAVAGDRVAIDRIRRCVLLDIARNRLVQLCGYENWEQWFANVPQNDMLAKAQTTLNSTSPAVSKNWAALGGNVKALDLLLFPSEIRTRGDKAAHNAPRPLIAESIMSLQAEEEKKQTMSAIYLAFFDEPVSLTLPSEES